MSNTPPHPDQQKEPSKHRSQGLSGKLKAWTGRRSQPGQPHTDPHSRSTSRLSHRGESPGRKNQTAEIVQLFVDTHNSVAPAEAKVDENKDALPSAEEGALGLSKDDDMWTIAEQELRKDPQKHEMLEKYDRILEEYFASKLEPLGTQERRNQFLGFLNSEIGKLNEAENETKLKRCRNETKKFFRGALKFIINSKDIITAAATPCLPASVACAGVTFLLSLCLEAADQRSVLFQGLNSISGSIGRIVEYEDLLSKDNNQQVEGVRSSIIDACCSIIEFQARAACFLKRNPAESAIRNAFKWDGWDELLSNIEKSEARVKDCAERRSLREIGSIFDKLNRLENKVTDELGKGFSKLAETQETIARKEKVGTFLRLLYNNACSYVNSKNRNRERVTGTCDWFTDHELFKKWNLQTETIHGRSDLLYVTADPGCGKSVLSRYLIDQILPDEERTVCYFFFKDDFENQKGSLNALCTFLHQLFDLNPFLLTDAILAKYEARGEKFVESFPELWQIFVDAAGCHETVCVLDALDECRDSDRRQLIDALINTRVPGLTFLLTSRPYDHIRREVSKGIVAQMQSIHLQGDRGPTADAIVQEIKLVVNSRIEEIVDSFRLGPDERQLIEKQMQLVPNRTYLWITLVFDGLMEKKSGITKKDIMNLTKRPPHGIYDAYERILAKSQDQKKSKRLLHLILGAKRPLSLSEMSVALAFNSQQSWDDLAENIIPEDRIQETIRDFCGLFVTVVDKKVYLIHQTAREFLICDFSDQKNTWSGKILNSRNHYAAANIFITQGLTILAVLLSIMQPIFHKIWLFLTNSWKHSIELTSANSTLAEICISYLHPDFATKNTSMFDYSAIYWVDHYHQSQGSCKTAVAEQTWDLCLPSETRDQWTDIRYDHCIIPSNGSPLCLAAALGLERAVQIFLLAQDSIDVDLQAIVNSKDSEYGQTALSWAAENGHEEVVKLLLVTGQADVNLKDSDGCTPLLWAAGNGHEEVVKLLLVTGQADVNLKDSDGYTPLLWAAGNGHEEVVKLLLMTGQADDVKLKDSDNRTPLSWAAENGHEEVVKLLLMTGQADVNSKESDGCTPLLWAARNGHEEVVKLLLMMDQVDVRLKDSDNRTPLLQAAENGHEEVVKLLLITGQADVKSKDSDGRTPLSLAAECGHKEVVKLLLVTGQADVNSKDSDGRTSLSWAAGNGHEEVVKLLLTTSQVDVDMKDDIYGQTPLSWAAGNGHEEVVKLLLATGQADVNSKDSEGPPPLSWAAGNGHEEVVKLLLTTSQVDVNSKDSEGPPPLSWAAANGCKDVVQLLLATGQAEVNMKDRRGFTPLSWAAEKGHEEVVKLLLATGQAKVNMKDRRGFTPLLWAAGNGHEEVVKLLLATSQVEINMKGGKYGRTPLSWAAENGHEEVVKLLLVTGEVDVRSKGSDGRTPLSFAAECGHKEVVKLLLMTGQAEVNMKDRRGFTPLLWAAGNGHEEVVKLLLATGEVNVRSKGSDGRTPLSFAAECGHEEVVKLLHIIDQTDV